VSGRDIALCVLTALTLLSPAAGAATDAMRRRKALPGDTVLVLAVAIVSGLWASAGWVWYFSGGTVS
jgi:hypothetical protein